MAPPESVSDKAAEARWFAEEIQPHEPMLRGWLRARFPALGELDDLVQESYVRLMRAKAAGKIGHVRTYLFSIARNAALDHLRRTRTVRIEGVERIDDSVVFAEGCDAAESTAQREELDLLAEAVQSLPACCRHVLVLQKIHGLSYHEIAERLGISERTVNAQVAKGMLRCRQYMQAKLHEGRSK